MNLENFPWPIKIIVKVVVDVAEIIKREDAFFLILSALITFASWYLNFSMGIYLGGTMLVISMLVYAIDKVFRIFTTH